MENNKIKKEINNIVNDNLKALEQLFPSAVKGWTAGYKGIEGRTGRFWRSRNWKIWVKLGRETECKENGTAGNWK